METTLNKEGFIEILETLAIPYNEGIQNDKDKNAETRIVFFEYAWEPLTASGKEYNTKVFYQVSFFARKPRHKKLIELKKKLAEKGIFVFIEHEYVQDKKEFHSYFKVEILEKLDE